MNESRATRTMLEDDRAELRFERRLAHSTQRVWQLLTDPAELAHWFPAQIEGLGVEGLGVEGERRIGADLRFVFTDVDVAPTAGRVLEFDPPRVLCLDWDGDVLRFELVPDDDGCLLTFTHTINGGTAWGGSIFTAQHAAGWDVCLRMLGTRLDGSGPSPDEAMAQWFERNLEYVEDFGLAEGSVVGVGVGSQVTFVRALVQSAEEVWQFMTEGVEPSVDGDPPLRLTNGYVENGPVTDVAAAERLAYRSGAGSVRLYLEPQDFGCVLRLIHAIPGGTPAEEVATVLAAWQTHLEVMVSTMHNRPVCPWPTDRTAELERMYRHRLAG